MKQNLGTYLALCLCLASLSGCDAKQENSLPPSEDPASSAPAAVVEPQQQQAPIAAAFKVDFQVSPGVVRQCPDDKPAIATVRWSVEDPAVAEIRVEVRQHPEAERKLLTIAGRAGEVATEAWVVAGTVFYLVDKNTNADIANFEVLPEKCS